MSQAGIVDIIGTHPEIPTLFVANVGTAVPIANTIELLGAAVAAHGVPLQTVASGNTVDFNIQYASNAASSIAGNAGVCSFSSTFFTVDANGYVTFNGSAATESFTVDAFTAPGTNPVPPNGSGNVTVTGGQVAAGTTANVIRTDSLAANTYAIQVQRSQAVAVSTIGDNGVSHFNNAYFTVDANGFVSLNGSAVGETITGDVGGALSPTAGNWNILATSTAAGTVPVQTSGSISTLTVQVQKSQAIAATNAANVGLAAFSNAQFVVDANGFVTLLGGTTGAILGLVPDAHTAPGTTPVIPNSLGNIIFTAGTVTAGTTPIRTDSLAANTIKTEIQISQAIAATDVTKIGLANFNSAHFSVDANGFVTLVNPSGFPWTDVIVATQALAVNNGYVTDHADVTYTLPATAVLGDTIKIVGKTGITTVAQNANQQILMGSGSSTVGITGSIVGTNAGDCVELICITAGASTVWRASNFVGNWTIN